VILTHAAAVTTKIRVGVSVAVLPVQNPIHVAHHFATLDYASGGRAILGVGLGRDQHYPQFQVPREHRVRRFREQVELIRALWTQPKVSYKGKIYQLEAGAMSPRPVQKPHPPIWFGGGHPDAVRRAGRDGRRLDGRRRLDQLPTSSARSRCCASTSRRRGAIRRRFRSPSACSCPCTSAPTSRARSFTAGTASSTTTRPAPTRPACTARPSRYAEKLEELVAAGANHLLLNPIARHAEHVEALASITGLA
jgi:alkanesulfonate monooxygenase SsuD/methylene tetrahydromethanopterin reductase-like flavin-dependent oxidoreductase (luciferase family)